MAGNATIRQGVEYEITANDKSGQVVGAAMARVDQAAKKTGESIGKAGAEGVKGFNVVNRTTLVPHVVPISALTTPEAEILIDREKGKVRTVAQQRKLILARRKEALGETVTDNLTRQEIPYRICGNVCVIGQHELSLGTLKGIVGEMEARQNRGRMPWRPDRRGAR